MTNIAANNHADLVVVGGGIVGLSCAWKWMQRFPDTRVIVLEQEAAVAAHQSGHNSGVIHSGVYYKPGSLKATTCRDGKKQMEQFCDRFDVPWERCGKVIVATRENEISRLESIRERGVQNGVNVERINTDQLREIEPNAAGIAALHVPESGIVNYRCVCETLRDQIRVQGGKVFLNKKVQRISKRNEGPDQKIHCADGQQIVCGHVILCGGLHSDRIAQQCGLNTAIRIVPFRGEYYELTPEAESLVRNLIYPVPDPKFPFLGVHFTRMIAGGIECGPNAVPALARHGYVWGNVSVRDTWET
ncbi:MAG: L-2-hydroxyglutarate oxidase, partial [Planctomycetota bacterium]